MAKKAKVECKEERAFSVAEAQGILPLLRSIVQDVVEVTRELRRRRTRLRALGHSSKEGLSFRERRRIWDLLDEVRSLETKARNWTDELSDLGVNLEDGSIGLVDIPWRRGSRSAYLCWQLGENQIDHWHSRKSRGARRLLLPKPFFETELI